MVLDKIHNVISFTQKAFAKEFIEEIRKLRSTALTKFKKSLYKFINNVLFRKSMQVLFIFLKTSWDLVQHNVRKNSWDVAQQFCKINAYIFFRMITHSGTLY